MQVSVKKPCTVYISFTGQLPNTFKLYSNEYGLYFFRQLHGRTPRIKFNLCHAGIYKSETPFKVEKVVPIEIPENLPSLPEYERSDIKDFVIVNNPELKTPARVFVKEGRVEKGQDFYKMPKPLRVFILLHEIGHFFYGITKDVVNHANTLPKEEAVKYFKRKQYESECKCDLFALVHYLGMGYNRSMAFYALNNVLSRSQDNINRVKALAANIQSTQKTNLYE